MFQRSARFGLSSLLILIMASSAWSQGRGGMGMGGGSAMGGSGFGGMGGGFGGMGMGGMGMGSGMGMGRMGGGFGGMGMGMGGMGMGGMGGGSAFGGMGGGSAFGSGMGGGFGNSGGMYGGQGGGQQFVGRDGADMNAVMSQMGRAGTQFFNQMSRNMGGRGGNRNRQAQAEENAQSAVRVQLNVAFDSPRPTSAVVVNNLRSRLPRLLTQQGMTPPEVSVENDVVVLRGVAADANQRLVLEKLIAMEPGVGAIRNEMTVAAPADDQDQPATSN